MDSGKELTDNAAKEIAKTKAMQKTTAGVSINKTADIEMMVTIKLVQNERFNP